MPMSKKKKILLFIDIIMFSMWIYFDRVTKIFAVINLKEQGSLVLVDGVLQLTFLENRGAMLGILQNQKAFLIFMATVFVALVIYIIIKMPDNNRFTIMHILLTALCAGAMGNMIDRIQYGYVVDFIYFILINFPIFNIADILISISTVIILILFLFFYKEKDLEFFNFKQKKYRELK